MKHGKIRIVIKAKLLVLPTTGPVCLWMKKLESYTCQQGLQLPIFMVAKEGVVTYMPILYWLWMHKRENSFGIINLRITTYGIGIHQHPLTF